jgi:hypothetical protein
MYTWMPVGLLFIHLLTAPFNLPAQPWAQTDTPGQIVDLGTEYRFGEEIIFQGKILSDDPAVQANFILWVGGVPGGVELQATVDPDGTAVARYNLVDNPIRIFSNLTYRLQVTLANGEVLSSPEALIYYEDNRFDWQHLSRPPFEIFWYSGETAFAQEISGVAQAGLLRAQDFLHLEAPEKVEVYVYDDPQAMQAALMLSGQSWVAGHALAEMNVIQVSLPESPEQRLEMERQIPHELMHILLHQADPSGYDRLPAWFNEGLASITEQSPNPDYQLLLENAYSKGTLLPMATLCQVFPRDASGALLAYAQSASFTRYLYQKYGKAGLEQLRAQYAAGEECQRGLELALGSSLAIQENQWRQEMFAENLWLTALQSLLPWLALLAAISAGPLVWVIRSLRRIGASAAPTHN